MKHLVPPIMRSGEGWAWNRLSQKDWSLEGASSKAWQKHEA